MIGIFDSGVGGLVSYTELRRLLPSEDIIYLADRGNAPYGTKARDELIRLVKKDIQRLRALGADRILIACCTASTVYGELTEEERNISLPIILPTAEEIYKAAKKRSGEYRVTVIATEHTAASHAFSNALNEISKSISVKELAAQELVSLAELGNRDGATDRRTEAYLNELSERIRSDSPDALVLGCTHFSRFISEFEDRLPGILILSPAHIGARKLYNETESNTIARTSNGRCLYTEQIKTKGL